MNALMYRIWLLRNRIGRLRVLNAAPKHGICAEIGVWKGDFSRRILQWCRPRELHLIDPWLFAADFPERWYGGAIARSQQDMDAIMDAVVSRFSANPSVRVHRGKSHDIVEQFPDEYFDWIYIDGNHSYEAVLDDLQTWHRKVKCGGVIGLDDYDWRDESRQLSVRAAIAKFVDTTKVQAAKAVQGQFLIRKA